jgi:hypothetical protein
VALDAANLDPGVVAEGNSGYPPVSVNLLESFAAARLCAAEKLLNRFSARTELKRVTILACSTRTGIHIYLLFD